VLQQHDDDLKRFQTLKSFPKEFWGFFSVHGGSEHNITLLQSSLKSSDIS